MITPDSAFNELNKSIMSALETYSNVHRGTGQYSQLTTHLYEKARCIVLESQGLKKGKYMVIFCSGRRADAFCSQLPDGGYKLLKSSDLGLSLGINALIIPKGIHKKIRHTDTGGGNTLLYGPNWVIWAGMPERFEAGTPAVINVIAFAKALKMCAQYGYDIFCKSRRENQSTQEIIKQGISHKTNDLAFLEIIRASFPEKRINVPGMKGLMRYINLDNAASTPAFGSTASAFMQTLQQTESVQKEIIQEVKDICASFVNVQQDDFEVVFTANTTESVNIIALNEHQNKNTDAEPVILSSIVEHSSNDLPWRNVEGAEVIRLGADKEGFLDLNELEAILSEYNSNQRYGKKRIGLVALSAASNVLGTCNDLYAAGIIIKKYGARFLVDAAQLVAHKKPDLNALNADYLVFSGHKMYAPFGTGVLVFRKGKLALTYDSLKRIKSSGEENAAGIAALGNAILILQGIGWDIIREEEKKLTNKVLTALSEIPDITIYGINNSQEPPQSNRTSVIAFEIKNRMSGVIARKLAYRGGIGIRYGCHCAHLLVKKILNFSTAQEKIQKLVFRLLPFIVLQGVMRVSFGIQSTEQDADTLISSIRDITNKKTFKKSTSIMDSVETEVCYEEKQVKQHIKEFISDRELLVYGK